MRSFKAPGDQTLGARAVEQCVEQSAVLADGFGLQDFV